MWHDGDYDGYNNYGDDDLPEGLENDGYDDYDQYEDWYMETGYDPYHLFETGEPNRLFYIRAKLRVWKRLIYWRWKKLTDKNFRRQLDDIPF